MQIQDRNRPLGLTALLGMSLMLPAVACSPDSQASEVEDGEEYVKTVNVEVQELEPSDFTSYIRLTGEIEALEDVVVSAEESGVIERFFVEKGKPVRRGAPIAKIRDDVLAAQVEEAAASAKLAEERFERQRRLWEEEEIGSEIAFLETKYQAQLQAARLKTLQARLERTVIRAPVSGIFDERHAEAGELVSTGSPVARIVRVDQLKVTGGVPERFAASVSVKDTARVRLDVLRGEEFVGLTRYVGTAVDERSRTFPIEVVIDNPNGILKPQMVASVEIADERLSDVLVVPQEAILRTEDGYQVFVAVERDGWLFAEGRPVELGPTYANRTVISEGLEARDRLIVRGHQLVEVGDRVRIVAPRAPDGETN